MTQTRVIILLTTLAALAVSNIEAAPSQPKDQGYNVLFIAIDDLNAWPRRAVLR